MLEGRATYIGLKVDDVVYVHEIIVSLTGGNGGLVSHGVLDLSLYTAWFEGGGDIVKYAALVFYNIIVGHPFINGNKRTALISSEIILYCKGFELEAHDEELINLTLKVANGEVDKEYVTSWFKEKSGRSILWEVKLPLNSKERRSRLRDLTLLLYQKRKIVYDTLAKY